MLAISVTHSLQARGLCQRPYLRCAVCQLGCITTQMIHASKGPTSPLSGWTITGAVVPGAGTVHSNNDHRWMCDVLMAPSYYRERICD
jgi:hypothetical protein